MKKLLTALLAIVMVLSMVSCDISTYISQLPFIQNQNQEHVHNFVISETESTAATCEEGGISVKVCSCGEKQEEAVEALGHDMRAKNFVPSCTEASTKTESCTRCGKKVRTKVDPIGHNYEETPSEPSRLARCLNEGCSSCTWVEYEGKYDEVLTFSFTKEDEAALDAMYDEILALLNAADRYDPALHAFAEEGELAEAFKIIDDKHTAYYEMVLYAISQNQLAQIAYYCDMDNTELLETLEYMNEYYTAVVAKFYTLSRPFYDSCYREFYYQGMTEEEIKAFLFDSDAVSNSEYTALKNRNNEIETTFIAMNDAEQKINIATLYAEFAENNNKMAKLMGYDNYLEYAYENVYGRDYSYADAQEFADYVKTYLSPVFAAVYTKWDNIAADTQESIDQYYSQVRDSFFESVDGNTLVNNYIDLLELNTNPNKTITFSDEFNKLMSDGNMFRGDYEGAYVTTIGFANLPIAYFGPGYDNAFTIVHEFGHYMNEVYSMGVSEINPDFSQSYDLLEMHSQGNELLYLCYLKENSNFTEVAINLIETYNLLNMLYPIIAGMTIDTFEQAIYLGTYDGLGADVIMADGKITADEYNALYSYICQDFGGVEILDGYWQYGMTITSPCYYISYSASAMTVLQLYEMANTDGFDAAKDAYLKLFTYVDENPAMTLNETLAYAGMLSYKSEDLYKALYDYFSVYYKPYMPKN